MVQKFWFKNQIQINPNTPIKNPNQIFQIYINCCPIYLFIIKLILKRFKEVKWVNLYIYTKNIFELKFAMLKSILTAFYYYCYPTTFLKQLFFDLYPKNTYHLNQKIQQKLKK